MGATSAMLRVPCQQVSFVGARKSAQAACQKSGMIAQWT